MLYLRTSTKPGEKTQRSFRLGPADNILYIVRNIVCNSKRKGDDSCGLGTHIFTFVTLTLLLYRDILLSAILLDHLLNDRQHSLHENPARIERAPDNLVINMRHAVLVRDDIAHAVHPLLRRPERRVGLADRVRLAEVQVLRDGLELLQDGRSDHILVCPRLGIREVLDGFYATHCQLK